MPGENPLDKLESLLKERQKKRPSYLKVLLDSVPYISDKASEWFNYEAKIAKKEIELLEHIMPETTIEWKIELQKIRAKFNDAIQSLDKIAEKVRKGKVTSISDIYERKPEERIIIPLPPKEQEEEALNLASSFLDILDSAQNLEDLIQRIERESRRTLTLRRLVLLELKSK